MFVLIGMYCNNTLSWCAQGELLLQLLDFDYLFVERGKGF